jgi:hypothetical protein
MTDHTYYKIMTWLGWLAISIGLLEVILYALGYYPDFRWSRLDVPIFAMNILIMVRMMKWKDETIKSQDDIIDSLRK